MTVKPPSADAQGYLENLMRAGQDTMKQFDDALASAAGVRSKDANPSGQFFAPFGLIADLQREYFKQLWRFWNTTFLQTISGGTYSNASAKSDKRFKDDVWSVNLTTNFSSNPICWAPNNCTSSSTERKSTTEQNCNSDFMLASILTR